jgi:hypothetical protein
VVLGVTMQAPHGLVLAPSVLQARECPASLRRFARRLTAPGTTLAGPEARPVAAGAPLAFMPETLNQLRGWLRVTRYTALCHQDLVSWWSGLGVRQHRRGHFFF